MTQHAFELIAKPHADLAALCGAAYTATDRKISAAADLAKLSPDKKLASCLASFVEHEPSSIEPFVGSHLFFSGFLIIEDVLVPE